MPGKLLFIHGTETRDVTGAKRQITERAQRILGWSPDQIVALEWGRTVGPPDLDITGALPPEYVTRGLAEELSEAGQMAAMWDLLFADPFVELRLLAVTLGQDSGGIWINSALASEEVQRRLKALSLPPEILDRAKLAEEDVADAAELLSNSHELTDAADHAGDADDRTLVLATARALVALVLTSPLLASANPTGLSPAAYSGQIRDELVAEVSESLSAGTRGFAGKLLGNVLAQIATKVAVAKRGDFMGPVSDFIRDISFYLSHGEEVRKFLTAEIRRHTENHDPQYGGPVVILAHSLGGIAAVDLLSDTSVMGAVGDSQQDRLKVNLLVTIGSQSPLLYLMDSMHSLRPRQLQDRPFEPWLNIYDREDLISFCAERVWPGRPQIQDQPVSSGVPFPMSHSAYLTNDHVYELIKNHPAISGNA